MMMLAAAVCLAGVTAAEDAPPCLADIGRLCNLVPPTGAFVQKCLEANRAALSAKCRKRVGTLTRDSGTLTAACRRDIDSACKDDPMSGDGHVGCLVKQRDKLSAACRDALDEQSRE
jgi:hypothetical protein